MTAFWIVAALMTFALTLAVVAPLLRRHRPVRERDAFDLAVYRDQLAELEREQGRGLLEPDQAQAAQAEIGRRMLALKAGKPVASAEPAASRSVEGRLGKPLALVLLVAIPVAALSLYLAVGRPTLPSQPHRQTEEAAATRAGGKPPQEVLDALTKMLDHLERNPEDKMAWTLLGRVYSRMERYEDSAAAYRKALVLAPTDAVVQGGLAEALIDANRGLIPEEARTLLEAVRATEAGNPRARFYLALARVQAGDFRAGLEQLTALMADSPADAPWLPAVQAEIVQVAQRLGEDPATVMPKPLPPAAAAAGETGGSRPAAGPPLSAEQLAAARNLSPEERRQNAVAMVERLAGRVKDQPDDPDDWLRLIAGYQTLGETAKADATAAEAASRFPDKVEILLALGDRILARIPEDSPPGPLPPDFLALLRKVESLKPDHPDVLWFKGLEAVSAGDVRMAAALWNQLLARLDPVSPEYAGLKARIAEIAGPGSATPGREPQTEGGK